MSRTATTPKGPVPSTREWLCVTCKASTLAQTSEFKDHLKAVHGLEPPLRATRTMELHLDAGPQYVSTYKWSFPGEVVAFEYLSGPRGRYVGMPPSEAKEGP